MKKEPERKIPYGIYRKGFFILVAGAESEGMAAKVAAIREHLERVGPIRAGVYRMLAVSGPDDAAGEPFLRVSGRHFKNGLAGCMPRSPRMPVILEGTRIPGYARSGGWTQAGSGSMGMDERPRYERRSGGECVPEECDTYLPCAESLAACFSRSPFFKKQSCIRKRAMHIYYTTRGLRGRPYHSDIINTDLFAFFQGKRLRTIPSAETLRAVNAFPQCDIDMGEDTDSEYVCEKGTFYIPTSIYMGEVVNAGWAVDYYFVVLCGDAVELRHVRWDCPWYETVGRDTEVTDPAVIAKMERTLAMLLDANKPRIPKPVPISRPALLTFLTLLGVADAEALADKIHAAATTPAQCAALCEEFGMEEVYTGWHVTLMRLALRDRKRLDWVDWKEAPEEVFASLCCLLPPGAKEHLPPCDDEDAYPEEVLRACSPVLHDRYGLTILLWDTGGDEYVFMVVPSGKVAEAFAAASELGIPLQRVEDLFKQE